MISRVVRLARQWCSRVFWGFARWTPVGEGDVSARRDIAFGFAGGAGGCREIRRHCPLRQQEAGISAPVPAVRGRHALARSFGRHLRNTRCREVPALFYGLGCLAHRDLCRGDRGRRKDIAVRTRRQAAKPQSTWSRPLLHASGWCWARSRSTESRTRLPSSPDYWR